MPEPTDHIILTRGPDGWSHRYTPPPTEENGYDLFGFTNCCKRMICAPRVERPLPEAAARALLNVTDCCDRPWATHGPKPVKLPPYSGEHTTCRKCGSKAVETRFTTRGADAARSYGIPRAGYPVEWLARRCTACRAEWDEAVITEPVNVADDSAAPQASDEHTETVTSEPNAALYMTCPLRHPYALRTTTTTVNGEPRRMHQELVCPRCEADGTTGLVALGDADG